MQRLFLAWLLSFVLISPVQANDKAAHFAASFALTTALYVTMSVFTDRQKETKVPSLISAIAMSLAIGLSKEIMDSMIRGDRYVDSGDMLANAFGISIAVGVLIAIDF